MFDTMLIAKRIKQARIDQNMTQLQLADAMGVSYQAVSNWERGNSMPDISKLADLCQTLGITVNELLGMEEPAAAAVTKAMEKEELTVEELKEVAPMLPPEEVKEHVEKSVRRWDEELEKNMEEMNQRISTKMEDFSRRLAQRFGTKQPGEEKQQPKPQAEEKRKKRIDLSAITELAEYLDEKYLKELVLEAIEESLDGIEDLAAYLSEETLLEVVKKARQEDLPQLAEIACHLSEKALECYVERIGAEDLEQISEIACYMGDAALDKLTRRYEQANRFDAIVEIACYLSEETLDGLVTRLIVRKFDPQELGELSELYAYMGDESLQKLAKYMMKCGDLGSLEEIMPYV